MNLGLLRSATCREPLGLELEAERPPGRAIGMVEYWNGGIMDFGKMIHWVIGKVPLDMGAVR